MTHRVALRGSQTRHIGPNRLVVVGRDIAAHLGLSRAASCPKNHDCVSFGICLKMPENILKKDQLI